MVHFPSMHHRTRAYTLGAVAFLGLLLTIARPLLKMHDEASWSGQFTSVFAVELVQDAGHTQVPVVSVH
jgi:hypothetical protein